MKIICNQLSHTLRMVGVFFTNHCRGWLVKKTPTTSMSDITLQKIASIMIFSFPLWGLGGCRPSGPVNDPLPVIGDAVFDTTVVDGKTKVDTILHTVSDFSLTDQTGAIITQKNLEGKMYVTDFFFTTCTGICPVMSTQMQRVYEKYKTDNTIAFVSHTVDPEGDSVPVMAAYAARHGAQPGHWYFLTGDKKQIYDLARYSYLITATVGDGGAEDFVHSQFFALVDKNKHIRGLYDGTDSTQVNKLMGDIEILKRVYEGDH
ncbi:MAG: SCO family protein [Bacteroidia bacterium]